MHKLIFSLLTFAAAISLTSCEGDGEHHHRHGRGVRTTTTTTEESTIQRPLEGVTSETRSVRTY